uniref:Putative secreted protein n=1 Tax=Panstrongylus lignarius TaxID=156445 RepID=A0A224XSX4_9HEMI
MITFCIFWDFRFSGFRRLLFVCNGDPFELCIVIAEVYCDLRINMHDLYVSTGKWCWALLLEPESYVHIMLNCAATGKSE